MSLPFDVDSEYNVNIKLTMPCEEIERGNRERCEKVKQDLNTLENRKA